MLENLWTLVILQIIGIAIYKSGYNSGLTDGQDILKKHAGELWAKVREYNMRSCECEKQDENKE